MLSKNKILTRDNLALRQKVDDKTVQHLFFNCVVVQVIWSELSVVFGLNIDNSFEGVAGKWLSNKRFCVFNIVSSATLSSIWKLRNIFVFQHGSWVGMHVFWNMLASQLRPWEILCPEGRKQEFQMVVQMVEQVARRPGRLKASG